jgi:hypothetical protein
MLTLEAKRQIAERMYLKGKQFLAAAVLLDKQGGFGFVVLHLVCQGIEIMLKAILLFRDPYEYEPRLKKIGHDLEKLARTVVKECGVRRLSQDLEAELKALNTLYSRHLLRYGSILDVIMDPAAVQSRLVMRKTWAVVRLTDRYIGTA